MVVDEIGRLELLAADLEAEISAAPEHMEGRLRVAAGKARLLASQKLAQFKGLCHKNMVSIAGVSSSGYCSLFTICTEFILRASQYPLIDWFSSQ